LHHFEGRGRNQIRFKIPVLATTRHPDISGAQLTEELKWGKPCYTFQKRNIVVILPLKEYCALLFCKGALLNDANGILIKPGENTQRGARFGSPMFEK
jgi:uncharacterized protein YdeI (YjbR/CyaY-like superfamily)